MTTALFAGTFSPPTLGHLDIIQRAAKIFDTLTIGVASNFEKAQQIPLFTPDEIVDMLATITQDVPNVEIVQFSGLVVDFAKKRNIHTLVRGLRPFNDFEYEGQMALLNQTLGNIETLFLMTHERYAFVSSSRIREVAYHGRSLEGFVPKAIETKVLEHIRQRKPAHQ